MSEAIDHVLVKYIELVSNTLHNDEGVYRIALYIKKIEQRIAELQCAVDLSYIRIKELESPKTCERCSLYGANIGNDYDKTYCTKLRMFINSDAFGCSYHEPKERE